MSLSPVPCSPFHAKTAGPSAHADVPFSCCISLPTSSLPLLTHACSLLSPLGIFLLNNQFFELAVNAHVHTLTHRRCLETGSIPLSVLLKEALTSFLALGQTHSYPSEEERGRVGEEGKWGHMRGKRGRGGAGARGGTTEGHYSLSGNTSACSFSICVRLTSTP